jgi:hypothetical protein
MSSASATPTDQSVKKRINRRGSHVTVMLRCAVVLCHSASQGTLVVVRSHPVHGSHSVTLVPHEENIVMEIHEHARTRHCALCIGILCFEARYRIVASTR